MKTVHTNKAPVAVGPYSQAIEASGFIFVAGQIGIDPKTNNLLEGLENQMHQIMKNLLAVLQQAKVDFTHVVKTTIYVKNMSDYVKVNEIYGTYFADHKPARATIGVSELPKGALVEIEMIAVK